MLKYTITTRYIGRYRIPPYLSETNTNSRWCANAFRADYRRTQKLRIENTCPTLLVIQLSSV